MSCWCFGDACSNCPLPTSFSLFLLVDHALLWNLRQVHTSSVSSPFTVVLSSEPEYADSWGSKRLLSLSSLQGHVFTAVLVWPVNLRIITHSALQVNHSCFLCYLLWLGFASCLLLPLSVGCFPVEPLCCLHALPPLTPPPGAAAS